MILPGATHDIRPLAHAIDPESSTYRVSKVKVELVLRKRETGLKWNQLVGEEEATRTSCLKEVARPPRPLLQVPLLTAFLVRSDGRSPAERTDVGIVRPEAKEGLVKDHRR